MKEYRLALESFQNLLVSIATGTKNVETEYRKCREEVMIIAEITNLLPDFVRTNRSSDQFWQYIKYKFGGYQERRNYIAAEFATAFDYLEGKNLNAIHQAITGKVDEVTHAYIHSEWQKAIQRKVTDPEAAITTARTLIETTCKYILDSLTVTYDDGIELPKLYKLVAQNLNLAPDQHTEPIFKQILGGCQTIVEGLGALRNKLSDSHGKRQVQTKPSSRHAELAVNSAGTMTSFLLETFEELKKKQG